MTVVRFKHVHLEGFAVNLPPIEVSSAQLEDRLSPLYDKLQIPFGTLERLSGIKTRYFWDHSVTPSKAASGAAKAALGQIGFPLEQIKSVFNCSVTRDHFEPATAMLVHRDVGVPQSSLAFDITNACLGLSDGIMVLGNLIESGVVKAGLLVSGETVSRIIDTSISKMLANDSITREELLKLLPTFTLGSGAVAMVLCHESIATKSHKIVGAAASAGSQYADLCVGNADFCYHMDETELDPIMHTDSPKLIASGALVGKAAWEELSPAVNWGRDNIDVLISHQVGRQLGDAFFQTVGVDNSKEYSIYKKYGNQVSAALPSAVVLAAQEGVLKTGSKLLLTGFGSGLNAVFTAVEW